MDKTRYDRIVNALFVVLVGLTFLSLFRVLIWLSCILATLFILLIALHIRDYMKKNPKRKKIFILTIIVLTNFLLANAVIFISNFVYPY